MFVRSAAIRSVLRATNGSPFCQSIARPLFPWSVHTKATYVFIDQTSTRVKRHFSCSIPRKASPTASPPTARDPVEAESQNLVDSASGLLEKGDVEGAKKLYQKSISMRPSSTAYYNLGITLYQLKLLPEAIDAWEKSLELAASADVHTNLASAYILSEPPQPQNALKHLKKAVELDPDDGEIRFNLAAVNEANDYLDDALAEYNHARQLGIKRAEQNIRNVGAKLLRRRLQEGQAPNKHTNDD